jgi:tellurite resistance protein
MKRRVCLGALVAACCAVARADPTPAERARIEQLLAAVAKRTDIRFLRNGKEYDSAQAADFLRGKYGWRIEKVATVQDFIEQIGTRSTASGDVYKVRLADGRTISSADFLVQELRRLEKR